MVGTYDHGCTSNFFGPHLEAALALSAAEKRALEAEVSWLREQKAEDGRALEQTAALLAMLQESHRALVASNQRLLLQIAEDKARHEEELKMHARNFAELQELTESLAARPASTAKGRRRDQRMESEQGGRMTPAHSADTG